MARIAAQVIAVKNGVKIKNASYRMSRRSAKKKAVTSQVRFTEWLPLQSVNCT
jgi:hypothetical protein